MTSEQKACACYVVLDRELQLVHQEVSKMLFTSSLVITYTFQYDICTCQDTRGIIYTCPETVDMTENLFHMNLSMFNKAILVHGFKRTNTSAFP